MGKIKGSSLDDVRGIEKIGFELDNGTSKVYKEFTTVWSKLSCDDSDVTAEDSADDCFVAGLLITNIPDGVKIEAVPYKIENGKMIK